VALRTFSVETLQVFSCDRPNRARGARRRTRTAAGALVLARPDPGKTVEARELLAPVYGWFTKGFDTRDLKEATVLREELTA
jgi:hypothetical protein